MKIALICQDLVGQGVQYVSAMTARMFDNWGWQIDVIVSKVNADLLAQSKKMFDLPTGVRLITMPSRRGSRNGFFLRKYLKTGGADMVICESGIYSWCVRWASLGISRSKLPRLVQLNHGTGPEPKGLWATVKTYLEYAFHYSNFYAYLFVDSQAMENARRFLPFNRRLRLGTVYNACCDEVFQKKLVLPPTHPWIVDKTCPTFVTAGAYEPYKDHLTLIEAVNLVKQKGHRIRVVIFGRGGLEAEYRARIAKYGLEDWVSVGGYTYQLPAEIKHSDGFVLSSNWESFGIVLAEGLACGVPCISTDAPYGPREILDGGKYGRLVPIRDAAALAAALIDGANGKIPIAPPESWQRFTIEAIADRYRKALRL